MRTSCVAFRVGLDRLSVRQFANIFRLVSKSQSHFDKHKRDLEKENKRTTVISGFCVLSSARIDTADMSVTVAKRKSFFFGFSAVRNQWELWV